MIYVIISENKKNEVGVWFYNDELATKPLNLLSYEKIVQQFENEDEVIDFLYNSNEIKKVTHRKLWREKDHGMDISTYNVNNNRLF